jgi:hypothetical protein
MATLAQFSKAALALPEAEEKDHFGNPSYRVRGKIFAGLGSSSGAPAYVKLPRDLQERLAEDRPESFWLIGWAHQGWIGVDPKKLGAEEVKRLLHIAWENVAPKKLVAAGQSISRARKSPARLSSRRRHEA